MSSQLPSWLKQRPQVESIDLELPPPSLNDNTADMDRLTRALEQKGFGPAAVNPIRLGTLAGRVRNENFNVRAVIGSVRGGWELLEVEPIGGRGPILAFAVDLGSTRLAFHLVDLQERRIIDALSVANPQIPYGEDILTRILLTREEANREMIQRITIDAFNAAMREMLDKHGFAPESVYSLTVAGNTTMSHFFLGLDATNICREPYIPAANHFPLLRGADLGLAMHPQGLIYVFPNVGSYFGGDLIAGILAAGMHRDSEVNILVDVGTNAEVVLGNRDWLIACAGAAGPALEGGVVERGMMAAPGAIDHVRINREALTASYQVIGGEKPKGICGSGLIDLVAEMFMSGVLTIQGKINREAKSDSIVATPDGPAYIVARADESADGKDLVVSEIDIGIFLKSKAAMYTILTVITGKVGLTFQDIHRFYVAGTFGNYIDPEMAIKIGMIPDLPPEKYQGLENTAGLGAAMAALDRTLFDEIDRVCGLITYVELNVNMQLMNEFRGALFLPHTNPGLFPSVKIPEMSWS
ncbi:MAG: ASKHA domain-containing protein [Syntrophobacteraceae bacterium]